jgi:hypothetical protein
VWLCSRSLLPKSLKCGENARTYACSTTPATCNASGATIEIAAGADLAPGFWNLLIQSARFSGVSVAELIRQLQKSEAHMRKNISFTVAAAIMGLGVILWAGASLISTRDDTRSTVGMSFHGDETVPFLRLQEIEPIN